ncbi:hypothetical protein VNI00_007755 [Paramarasmius palmivorus]|uniref:Alpha/beta hydrolase fold-3 domain-containing protein n=1 Tax=Paramarasmius palmivorus TaxID=297713 RepID=A0AAW0D3I8_9AGAR
MVLKYRYQPMKAVYLLGGALWLLCRIPFWIIRNLLPAWRPHRRWSFGRAFAVELTEAAIALMFETSIPSSETIESLAARADANGFVWVDPFPEDLIVADIKRMAEVNMVEPARTGGCWYGAKNSDGSVGFKAAPGEKVFYMMHGKHCIQRVFFVVLMPFWVVGGGFIMGNSAPSYPPAAIVAQGLLEHVKHVPRLFASEYRIAAGPPLPIINPFPAAMLDVLAGYHYLIHQLNFAPENIIVVGDSAGGVLGYQLVRYCTQYSSVLPSGVLPVPGALLMLSPSADSAFHVVPGSSMVINKRSDYVQYMYSALNSMRPLLGHLPGTELDQPWLSPGSPKVADNDKCLEGIFKSFSRTMIVAGEAEMGRDPMRLLRGRMDQEMGDDHVYYLEVEDAPHNFLGLQGGSLWEPERTFALEEIARWVDSL